MRTAIVLSCAVALFGVATAQASTEETDRAADELAVRQLVADLENAWHTGDGAAFGAAFAEDADFMVWFGLYLKGRARIAEAHQHIFDGVYAGTAIEFKVASVRFLGPDVALLRTEPRLLDNGEDDAGMPPVAVPLIIAHRVGGAWRIVAVQNTPYLLDVLDGEPELGDIRAFRQRVRARTD